MSSSLPATGSIAYISTYYQTSGAMSQWTNGNATYISLVRPEVVWDLTETNVLSACHPTEDAFPRASRRRLRCPPQAVLKI
jgi:hypothetical protein